MKKITIIFFAFFLAGLTAGAQTQTPPKKAKLSKAHSKNKMLVAVEAKKPKEASGKAKPEARKEGE